MTASTTPERDTNWIVILGLWAAGLGAAAQFGKVSVSFSMLSDYYGAGGAALGFAVSLVGLIGIVFGVTAGLLVARVGYRRALIAALALGALMSAYQALLPALPLFLFSRAVEGASHLAIVVAAPTLIAQLTAPRHRGITLSLWSTFFGVAFALLVWFGLPLARAYGAGALYLAHSGFMAAMCVLIGVMLPRDVIEPVARGMTLPTALADHLRIYLSPWQSAPAFGWVCYAGAWVAILTIMPRYLPPDSRDVITGLMPLAGIAVSMTLGVWLMRRMSAISVVLIGFSLSILCAVAIWAAPAHPAPYLALAATLGLIQGGSFTAVAQLNITPLARAEANGAMAQMGNVGTTCGTPILAALVAGAGVTGFLFFALALFSWGFLVHLLLARRRRTVPA